MNGLVDPERWRRVRFLILDVDGVLTDGTVLYDGEGREAKAFHVHDGLGLHLLRRSGLLAGVISGRDSQAVRRRMIDLGIDHWVLGEPRKLPVYEELLRRTGLSDGEAAYMGDDLLDLPVLRRVGLALTVPGARPEVKRACHYVTGAEGGRGAVREVVELLLRSRGLWEETLARYDA